MKSVPVIIINFSKFLVNSHEKTKILKDKTNFIILDLKRKRKGKENFFFFKKEKNIYVDIKDDI